MAVTNEQIYKKLVEVEDVLKKVAAEEELIEQEVKLEGKKEREELELLKRLQGKDIKRMHNNIIVWKNKIWDACSDKKSIPSKRTIDFLCKKTGKTCRFVDCYRNKVG